MSHTPRNIGLALVLALAPMLVAAGLYLILNGPADTPWRRFLLSIDARLFVFWGAGLFALFAVRARASVLSRLAAVVAFAALIMIFGRILPEVPLAFAERIDGWATADAAFFKSPSLWLKEWSQGPWPLTLLLAVALAATTPFRRRSPAAFCFCLCFAAGLCVARHAGWDSRELPPDLHDEYSYLFQASSFLAGRTTWPADALTPAFAQLHVLHGDVYASRYFPGTALLLAPFVHFEAVPWFAWICAASIAGFVGLAARRHSPAAGYCAGLIAATFPGVASFGNAILSPAPTMAAIAAFYWSFFRAVERPSPPFAAMVGAFAGLAFITRPLTAACLGLPFALYSLRLALRGGRPDHRRTVAIAAAMFALFVLGLFGFNRSVTGRFFHTPYEKYNVEVTPSHVFGFYNKIRGESRRLPTCDLEYDSWAEETYVADALFQTALRTASFFDAGLGGAFTFSFFYLLSLLQLRRADDRELLLHLSALGLLLGYLPFWFGGVQSYSYLAEAMPAAAILASIAIARAATAFPRSLWPSLISLALLRGLLSVALIIPSLLTLEGAINRPRLEKSRLADWESLTLRAERAKLLLLVDARPGAAMHTTLVHNEPSLAGPVVRAWDRPELHDALLARFPDRAVHRLVYRGSDVPIKRERLRGPLLPGRVETR
ncbi:MAG TPA: glycosyltransferase family 39 protein [Planctomycetia bacterium]|nr:glycosyltransferase family 39 protein [Planctomycetia bacterium]